MTEAFISLLKFFQHMLLIWKNLSCIENVARLSGYLCYTFRNLSFSMRIFDYSIIKVTTVSIELNKLRITKMVTE